MPFPYISIIIPTYNSAATLSNTIKACLNQDYPRDRFEIIIVDDGSTDNTRDIVKKFPVIYIFQKKSGPACARNNGWKNSKGNMLCFTDADCTPHSDWVSKLVECCNKNNASVVAGSYSINKTQKLLNKFINYEIIYRTYRLDGHSSSFGTYNVLISRDALYETNGFDPSFSISAEDTDISYRIIKRGYLIYFEKQALVDHDNSSNLFQYLFTQFRHGYWRTKLYKDNKLMMVKDRYGYWKDYAEIFLVVVLIFYLLLNLQKQVLIIILLISFIFVIQLSFIARVISEKKMRGILFFLF